MLVLMAKPNNNGTRSCRPPQAAGPPPAMSAFRSCRLPSRERYLAQLVTNARTACGPRPISTTSRFPYPAIPDRFARGALAGSARARAKFEPWREYSEPGQSASPSTSLIDADMAARARRKCSRMFGPRDLSRKSFLTFTLDKNADDRIVGGLVFGSNRCELGLDALPRATLEQIGIGVHCHAGHFLSVAAARVLVGGAHQRNVADNRDEFVADIPVNDDFGIEGGRPILQIGRAIPPLAGRPDVDEGGMKDGVVRGHVVCHKVMDKARIQRAQFVHRLGRLVMTLGRLHFYLPNFVKVPVRALAPRSHCPPDKSIRSSIFAARHPSASQAS